MPRISVIVPNYNHARFLGPRLQSIAEQTYRDFELIILDDASTDHSLEVIEAFTRQFPARVIRSERNSGSPFVQWNRGVQEARGEFVWLAESDDFADPQLLQQLVARIEFSPRGVLAYCQSWIVRQDGQRECLNTRHTADVDAERWTRDFVGDGATECARYLVIRNTIPNASAVLFRRAAFLEAGGAATDYRLCGDWITWMRMLLLGDVAFCAEPLNSFRSHPATQRAQGARAGVWAMERYRVLEFALSRFQPEPAALEQARRLCFQAFTEWHAIRQPGDQLTLESVVELARRCDPMFDQRKSVAAEPTPSSEVESRGRSWLRRVASVWRG